MKIIPNLRLAYKLPLFIVGFSVLVTAIFVTISSLAFQRNAIAHAEEQFHAMTEDRSMALKALVEGIRADASTLAAIPSTATALEWFTMTWEGIEGDPQKTLRNAYIDANPNAAGEKHLLNRGVGDSPYHMHHARFHPSLTAVLQNKGYYDVFLINTAGDVVYSVTKEADYASNLVNGAYADSGLGKAFRAAIDMSAGEVTFADLEAYAPSNGDAAAFVASPVFDAAGDLQGAIALQVPVSMLTKIVNPVTDMNETLDVFIIGQDLKVRTNSRHDDVHEVLEQLPETEQISTALTGESGFYADTVDSHGTPVVAYSQPIDMPQVNWAIVAEQARAELFAPVARERNILLLISLVCAAVMSLIGWLFARSITHPISRICNRIEEVASGNLESNVPEASRNDEIGDIGKQLISLQDDLKQARSAELDRAELQQQQEVVVEQLSSGLVRLATGDFSQPISDPFPSHHEKLRENFNRTSETLSSTVTQVIDTAESIRSGANEISQASDDLSNRTESQAATLEETAAALDEMTASVKSAAEGARSVETIMQEAKQEAETSGEVVQSAVSAMTEIEQSSTHISQIISVIDDIAFQTNLLALNAGVEAARAGEAGKGFAVVASEVRALAQRSSDAAMEIKTLIGDSTKQVERGVDLVGKTGDALQGIVERVSHISQLVSGIATGASEQSTGLHEINTGVTQLDQVTQQNAAMVEEATAAGHMLNADASKLADLVAHFRVAAGGGQAAAPARKSTAAPAAQPQKTVAMQDAPPAAPSAHGDDWDIEAVTPQPVPAAASTSGNAAKDIWQDF
ncbi:methyl-accepting chemotaxis protein [Phaeobacter gallaeciensis]|uniref:Methyl-accepting chemotaxis protein n=1 Tax=Phaeobacter gallaeciensis TaxID=60890 RepID=A0AAC9ZD60_9RHOB|nr:methyl-accepting chemotaxis protein [Phaeobacter gallaeciensis]AHD11642.1 Methyl-accepting chemotaxis protein [Phaeobacter gallaeciensis DSM 26640]ATE94906.1 Methyl-accepting chemotaxis protein [Phaeobacter gallaeciensis]ATE99177.1 Methyl-accepting chemotaxis protein [Phaeobacter gallaeciensis]ATF03570.1 Methyl-accepting chemotaxis protein [Phaeobacter gallaeciensis]ATF07950.1 Methyl-accepting chemotaxis protein [Phaeobacter gallaeciensis]